MAVIDDETLNKLFATRVRATEGTVRIDADGMHYRLLNAILKALNHGGVRKMEIHNVYGQRYIGTGLKEIVEINIYGTPGNDLGAFMNGQKITVYGNAQDGCGNTMDDGQIVIHGHVGDIVGYSMRSGKIFVRDDAGYRAGIHMKGYGEKKPYLVIGGTAQDFLGEYMAGGVLVVLGLNLAVGERHKARFVGTGMHGGVIYVRGEVSHLGKEVAMMKLDKNDMELLNRIIEEFCDNFGFNKKEVMNGNFNKIIPFSHRPYGTMYAY